MGFYEFQEADARAFARHPETDTRGCEDGRLFVDDPFYYGKEKSKKPANDDGVKEALAGIKGLPEILDGGTEDICDALNGITEQLKALVKVMACIHREMKEGAPAWSAETWECVHMCKCKNTEQRENL